MKLPFFFKFLLIFNLIYHSVSVVYCPKISTSLRNKLVCFSIRLIAGPDATDDSFNSSASVPACSGQWQELEPPVVSAAVVAAKYPDSVIKGYQLDLQSQLHPRLPSPILNFCYKLISGRKVMKKATAHGIGVNSHRMRSSNSAITTSGCFLTRTCSKTSRASSATSHPLEMNK